MHRILNENGKRILCPGSSKPPFRMKEPDDGLTAALRNALEGIPGPTGWGRYMDSRAVYVEIGGCLLAVGLTEEDAAKLMEAAFWAAARVYK